MATKKATGLMTPLHPDKVLAAVVGTKPISRPEIVKGLWAYIRKHDLQSSKDGRVILCGKDKKLKQVFKKDKITMFEMNKAIGDHVKA